MIIDHEYRLVLSDQDAIEAGYPNLASYRLAVSKALAESRTKSEQENGKRRLAKLRQAQTGDAPSRFFAGPKPKGM